MKNNKKTNHKKDAKSLTLWAIVVVITIFVLVVIPYYEDIKILKVIKGDILATQGLLEAYISEHDGISERLLTDINLEEKARQRLVHDLKGINESVGLNKNYYRIPGIINVLVESKLEGNFICDLDGSVYYIHNKTID